MISGGIEFSRLAQVYVMLETKFGHDPLSIYVDAN